MTMTRRPINNDKILYLKKTFLLNDKWRWSTLSAAVAAQTHADSSFWLQNMRLTTPVTFQYLNNITVDNSCNLLSDFLHLNSPPGSLLASREDLRKTRPPSQRWAFYVFSLYHSWANQSILLHCVITQSSLVSVISSTHPVSRGLASL